MTNRSTHAVNRPASQPTSRLADSVDLTTQYMGLALRNPLMVAACPLTGQIDVLKRLEQAGAAGAVLPSLFEEQIAAPELTREANVNFQGTDPHYFRELMHYNRGPEAYLKYIECAKRGVSIPIIASLNGVTTDGWLAYSRQIQQAGADALELNLMIMTTDPDVASNEIEDRYLEALAVVRSAIKLPLAVKIGPYFSALPHFVRQLAAAGADAVVLFNRYLQPELNLATRCIVPQLQLSTSNELGATIRWIGILRGQVEISLAANNGIHSEADVLKCLSAGADVVQFASTIYHNGLEVVSRMKKGLEDWLSANDYPSVASFRGTLSQRCCPDPAAFVRANYVKTLSSYADGTQ